MISILRPYTFLLGILQHIE